MIGIRSIDGRLRNQLPISAPFVVLWLDMAPAQNECKSAADDSASEFCLRLRPGDDLEPRRNQALLSSGVAIECDLREIAHPEGRFMREDGTRYDICVMELFADPTLRPPAVSRANFVGDRTDTQAGVIRLGNVRQSSFRLCLISPGEAFGTSTATSKSLITLAE